MKRNRLEFSSTAFLPDGTEFAHQTNRTYPDDTGLAWFVDRLQAIAKNIIKAAGNKDDGENLTVLMRCSVNDVQAPDISVPGISYHELVKIERAWWKLEDELIKVAEGRVSSKK